MRNIILSILLLFCAANFQTTYAQNYEAPPVSISSEKIRMDGRLYYQHKVLDRQTLFSISKAYGVSIEEITGVNPSLADGQLKSGSIILIPVSTESGNSQRTQDRQKDTVTAARQTVPEEDRKHEEPASEKYDGIDYSIHIVKWYESLRSISKKYGISEEILAEFNNLESTLLKKRQKLRIPDKEFLPELAKTVSVPERNTELPSDGNLTTEEGEKGTDRELAELIAGNRRQTVRIALILPLDCTTDGSGGNVNYMDFYSGALLASKSLSEAGMKLELKVIDSKEYVSHTDIALSGILDDCHFVIGPIHKKSLVEILPYCKDKGINVVSPLDPKASSLLAEYTNLFQAPVSTASQFQSIAEWIRTYKGSSSPAIVISESAGNRGDELEMATNALTAKNIGYKTFSYNILQGRGVDVSISNLISKTETNHIIIASENEAFVNDVIRNLNTIATMFKYEIRTYATSKVNHFETISADNFHNTNLHLAMGYYIDYDEAETVRFISEYRALFNTEPSQFAFQGYDMLKYFATLSIADRIIFDEYPEKPMLQSNIEFKRVSGSDTGTLGGYENVATRNIIFGSNYSVKIEK